MVGGEALGGGFGVGAEKGVVTVSIVAIDVNLAKENVKDIVNDGRDVGQKRCTAHRTGGCLSVCDARECPLFDATGVESVRARKRRHEQKFVNVRADAALVSISHSI